MEQLNEERLIERRSNPVLIAAVIAGILIGAGLIIFLNNSSSTASSLNNVSKDERLNYWQKLAKDDLNGTPKVLTKTIFVDDEGRWLRLYVEYSKSHYELIDLSPTHVSIDYVSNVVEPGMRINAIAGREDNDPRLKTKIDIRKAVRYVVIEPYK